MLPSLAFTAGLLEQGSLQRRQGNFAESILSLQRLLKSEPENARAWFELGLSYATDAQYAKAADAYRLALARGYADPQCHCALGLALREAHKPQAALSESKRCLELIPGYAGAWNLIGNVEIDLGHFEAAREAYQKAVVLSPGYANARFNLGLALGALGRDLEAQQALSEALSLQPKLSGAWAALGDCLLRRKQARGAMKHYQKALRLDPLDADAEWGLARAWRMLGDEDKARDHESAYRRVLRESDNRGYFSADAARRRRESGEMEAWEKDARERH